MTFEEYLHQQFRFTFDEVDIVEYSELDFNDVLDHAAGNRDLQDCTYDVFDGEPGARVAWYITDRATGKDLVYCDNASDYSIQLKAFIAKQRQNWQLNNTI